MFKIKEIILKTEKGLVCRVKPLNKRFSSLQFVMFQISELEKLTKEVNKVWMQKAT